MTDAMYCLGHCLNPLRTGARRVLQLTLTLLLAGSVSAYLPGPDAVAAETAPGFYGNPLRFEIRVGAWLPQTRSNQKTSNTADDRVNFENLDVTPDNAFPVAELNVTLFNRHRFRGEYWDSTASGKKFLANNITFNGTVFPASSNVEATLQASSLKLGYEFLLVNQDGLRLGLGGGAQIFSAKSQIKLTSGATESTRHDDRTIWFLSGDLALKVAFLELFGNIDALSYETAALLDARAGASFCFDLPPDAPFVALGLGADWRISETQIHNRDVDGTWTIQGLELFVFARF